MHYLKSRRLIATLLTIILIAATFTPANQALAGGDVGARAMLIEYYNLINAGDYWTAYQQWESPTQTYADFVNGYSDTSHVSAYFGGFQARQLNGLDGCVAGMLIGYHTNGSVVAYQGSYDVSYHPEATGIRQWTIMEGTFAPLDHVPVDTAPIYRDYLDVGCIEHGSGIEPPPSLMFNDYLDAVNRGEYDEAYTYWTNPVQTYAEFVTGWGDTTETVWFFGYYQPGTSVIEVGRIPVVMFGYHTDGSRVSYQGCLGLSHNGAMSDLHRWGLYAAYLYPMSSVPTTSATISATLNVACY